MTGASVVVPADRRVRVGIIGHGSIGAELVARLRAQDDDPAARLRLAWVAVQDPARHPGLPPELVVTDVAEGTRRGAELVVEAARPEVSRSDGETILRTADYLPLSATALVDEALRARLVATAQACGHRLLLPGGALVGATALAAIGEGWASVTVTMEKPPRSLPKTAAARSGRRRVLADGPVRELAARFPRNVNAMVVAALSTIGLDRTRGVVVADPARREARLAIEAVGQDGSHLRVERLQPMRGVSGTEMGASAWQSVLAATGTAPTLSVV